ncbi:MAG: DUF2851 family protein [Rhodothermales bacterium]
MPDVAFQPKRLTPNTPHFYGLSDTVFEVTLHEPGLVSSVPEALVQDVWQAQRFDAAALVTSSNEPVTILDPGTLNTDRGPDFTGALLRIGDTEWTGDVEIHTTSSQWFDHKHHLDALYNGVVLHVALHADIWTGGLLRADGATLPELILYPHLDTPLRKLLYQFYTQPAQDIRCASGWARVSDDLRDPWIHELALERMREKKDRLAAAYLHAPALNALLHERLFAGLGYAKNAQPMTTLARRLPLSLARSLSDPLDLEALHLGVAGLLPSPADLLDSDRVTADYVMDLRERFERLQLHMDIPVMARTAWRFFRLRPANFPPLRIAQGLAWLTPGGLLHHDPLGTLVEAMHAPDPVEALCVALSATPGSFWATHVRLEKATRPRDPSIGRSRLHALIANAVVPVLMLHAEQTSDTALESAVLDLLRQLPPEKDEITRRFTALDFKLHDALAAQGLHQLFRTRCSELRCLSCAIGQFLLDRG